MTAADVELVAEPVAGQSNRSHQTDHTVRWIALCAALVSIAAYLYTFSRGAALGYRDSISHLQIAARTLDSPTAGFGQLGGVWLPLPHLLMLPLVWIQPFYYSGFAGSAISMVSYVIATVYIYKIGVGLTGRRMPAIAGTLVFALNPNVLYLQSTAMTELLLFACIAACAYYLQRWIQTGEHRDGYPYLFAAGVAAILGCLTRYEAWVVTVVMIALVGFAAWRKFGMPAAEGITLSYLVVAGAGIGIWLGWNWLIFGNPMNFQNGEYAKPSLWVSNREEAVGNAWVAVRTVWYAVVDNLGIVLVVAMLVGAAVLTYRRRSIEILPVLSLLTIAPFFVVALAVGQRPLHVVQINGDLYNIRFGLLLVLPAAVLVAYLVSLVPVRWAPAAAVGAAVVTLLPALLGGPAAVATLQEAATGSTGIIVRPDGTSSGVSKDTRAASRYLLRHYDDGLVLGESFGNESVLFDARVPLSNNVYEGSYRMWEPALRYPAEHDIRWIVMRTGRIGADGVPIDDGDSTSLPDEVAKRLGGTPELEVYDRVYSNGLYSIYKRKS